MLAKLIGLPGKYTIAGEDVEYLFRQGRLKEINQYCMTDVLQTYLLFLRVELLRGKLDAQRIRGSRYGRQGRFDAEGYRRGIREFPAGFSPAVESL